MERTKIAWKMTGTYNAHSCTHFYLLYTPHRFTMPLNDVYVSISFSFFPFSLSLYCTLDEMNKQKDEIFLFCFHKCERKEEEEEQRFIVCKTLNERTTAFESGFFLQSYPYQLTATEQEGRRTKSIVSFSIVTWLTKMKRTPHQTANRSHKCICVLPRTPWFVFFFLLFCCTSIFIWPKCVFDSRC